MSKNSLVVLRGSNELKIGEDTFQLNKFYRYANGGENNHIVYGVGMDDLFFNEYFEFVYCRVIRHWTEMGLIVNGKPISKKGFKEFIYINNYGKRKVLFIRNHDNIYGFYVDATTNVDILKFSYKIFLDVIDGEMIYFDSMRIQYGNCGIPLSGGNLRVSTLITK